MTSRDRDRGMICMEQLLTAVQSEERTACIRIVKCLAAAAVLLGEPRMVKLCRDAVKRIEERS